MRYDTAGVRTVVAHLKARQIQADQEPPLYAKSGVACFNYLYTIITDNVLRCVEGVALQPGDPHFNSGPFMACFDVAFAERYFAAIGMGKKPPFQPQCWDALLRHGQTPGISPLVFAVAGVNAHVNFDLAFALVRACELKGRAPSEGTIHADYQMINEIFANHMQQLRQHFEDRFQLELDEGDITKIENVVGDVAVIADRDAIWAKAEELWSVHLDQAKMVHLARSRDREVAFTNDALFAMDRFHSLI